MWYSLASYAALAALGLLALGYYNPRFFHKFHAAPTVPLETEQHKAAKKQKIKKAKAVGEEKARLASPASRNEGGSKKRKIVTAPISQSVKATSSEGTEVSLPRDDEGSMSNKEFAQQLAQVQAGVLLDKKQAGGKGSHRRTVKPSLKSQLHGLVESPTLSANTSSTGGRDADDDMSLNESPPLGTPLATATPQAGDVSDMLEPAAAAPRTLRLTDVKTAEEKKKKKKAQQPKYEPVLTKKQKQRQKIQEENRRLREESDRLHEAKKQQQLTTARLADGSSKQIKANSFAASAQNAWQKKPAEQTAQAPAQQPLSFPLLDTFDAGKTVAAPEQQERAVRTSVPPRRADWADQVNEEEQNEWEKSLAEEESWEPVASKKSKKKNRKDTDTSSEASGAVSKHQTSSVTSGSRKGSFGGGKLQQPKLLGENRFASMEELNGGGGDTWEA